MLSYIILLFAREGMCVLGLRLNQYQNTSRTEVPHSSEVDFDKCLQQNAKTNENLNSEMEQSNFEESDTTIEWNDYSFNSAELSQLISDISQKNVHCATPLVFDVGFGRTGTNTMIELLRAMGFSGIHGFQVPKITELRQFMSNPLAVHNSFTDIANGTALADVPFFGIPCELQVKYPYAKFIYVTRNVNDHFKSVQYMHCAWDRPIHCKTEQKCVRGLLWGKYFVNYFCPNSKKLCDKSKAQDSPIWETIRREFEQNVMAHAALVRKCIPEEQRLEVSLEELHHSSERIMNFLGCKGSEIKVPHDYSVAR